MSVRSEELVAPCIVGLLDQKDHSAQGEEEPGRCVSVCSGVRVLVGPCDDVCVADAIQTMWVSVCDCWSRCGYVCSKLSRFALTSPQS